jgi:hypothetical protein
MITPGVVWQWPPVAKLAEVDLVDSTAGRFDQPDPSKCLGQPAIAGFGLMYQQVVKGDPLQESTRVETSLP